MPLKPLTLEDTLKADAITACAEISRYPEMMMAMCMTPANWTCAVFVPILRPSKDQLSTYETL